MEHIRKVGNDLVQTGDVPNDPEMLADPRPGSIPGSSTIRAGWAPPRAKRASEVADGLNIPR